MPAVDDSRGKGTALESPLANLALVTPADGEDLAFVTRAIYVGTAGAVALVTLGGQSLTTPELAQGWHPIRATRILATGTTATGIMAAW